VNSIIAMEHPVRSTSLLGVTSMVSWRRRPNLRRGIQLRTGFADVNVALGKGNMECSLERGIKMLGKVRGRSRRTFVQHRLIRCMNARLPAAADSCRLGRRIEVRVIGMLVLPWSGSEAGSETPTARFR